MRFLFDGPADAAWTVALAHGAGQGMDSPFMDAIARGLAAQGQAVGGLRTARFEFPYMAASRHEGRRKAPDRQEVLVRAWLDAIAALEQAGASRARLAIGGKSLGGRIASLVADAQQVAGLVCLGYPFHPPGRPERLRTAHLERIATPTLICQGTRDPFGLPTEVVRYRISPAVELHWIDDGDHSFKPPRHSSRTDDQNWSAVVDRVVEFMRGLVRHAEDDTGAEK